MLKENQIKINSHIVPKELLSASKGAYLCTLAFALFSLQDAAIKMLVENHSVFEVLYWRSVAVIVMCFFLKGPKLFAGALESQARWRIAVER